MTSSVNNNRWIIHFSGDDFWNSNPHSRHHISQAFLNNGYKVLWVNPMGARFPSIKKRGFSGKIFRKLKSLSKILKKSQNGMYVITPFTIPIFKKSGWLESLNKQLLLGQIKLAMTWLRVGDCWTLHTTPNFANTLEDIKSTRTIYYYSDQYTLYRELSDTERDYMEAQDKKLYCEADLIVCASMKIYDGVNKKTNKPVRYYPHQVDYQKFHDAIGCNRPTDLTTINHPIIGYYGSLSDSNDWELIKYCANQRPQYNFVFIGRKDQYSTGVETLPNVFFLGKKDYQEIQNYGACFDVAIMFWVRRDWIKHCSPLKLKEYLALGKPIVSTLIEEVVKEFSEVVYVAADKVEFLAHLDKAVTESKENKIRIERGLEIVKNDNWDLFVGLVENEFTA